MPTTEEKWVKFGNIKTIAFLGKEIIGIASGLHIIFINLNTKEERVEKFNNKERGEGVCCLTGHPVVPMFAVSERKANPKIRVYTYPTINKISECIYDNEKNFSGFLSSKFAGTDYLVTLTSLPHYKIIIWLWRSGECLSITETEIFDDSQKITCSSTSPTFITQLGENSGELKVYELNICSKIISLTPITISITQEKSEKREKITSSSWMYDSNLLYTDDIGNVFLMLNDGKRCQLVIKSEKISPRKYQPLVVAFRGGAVITNLTKKIQFYRKSSTERFKFGTLWKTVWEIETTSWLLYLGRHPQRDSILICTICGEISEISVGDDDIPRLQIICQQGSNYLFINSVNCGRFVGAFDNFSQLNLFESYNGKFIAKIMLNQYGNVLCIVSHPALPVLAASTSLGKCIIINLYEVSRPFVMFCFYLMREPLEKLKFSQCGRILGVCNMKNGKIFIIKDFSEVKIDVWTLVDISEKIVDYLIYQNEEKEMFIVMLLQTNKKIPIGKYIIIYKIKNSETFEIEFLIKLSNIYPSLHYGNNFGEIIASPFLTRQLHLIKTQGNFQKFILTDTLSSSHRLRDVNINSETKYFVTFGYDGIVIIRNKTNPSKLVGIFTVHHRQEGGIKYAILCLSTNIIVTLGKNGNLIASRISQMELTDVDDYERNFLNILRIISDMTRPEFNGNCDETWIEMREAMRLKKERDEMAVERASILHDFSELKGKLKELIDNNENASNSKLPLEIFDLDKINRQKKIEECKIEQEKLLKTIEEKILCENKISEFLQQLCWKSMEIPACALISLDGKIRVDNYALPVITEDEKKKRIWEKFYIDLSTKLSTAEAFYSNFYNPNNNSNNEKQKEKMKIIKLLKGDEKDEEEKFSMTGTTTHRWIREDPSRVFNQILRNGSYTEGITRNILTKIKEEKLKKYFNKLFEEMRSRKLSEIKLAKERIAKIHHCLMELKEMFQVEYTVDHSWLKLEWQDSEKPETVVKVEDEEVYKVINDSKMLKNVKRLVNPIKCEETNVFGDFFRSQTLETMMNGVLEIKWEDEIKKDIIKPDCLFRDPSTYSEEDLKIIEIYNKAVENLEEERKKYKKILEEKIEKLEGELKLNVIKFNKEMEQFFLKRIKVESAVLQETLMRLREAQRHQLRLKGVEEVARIEIEELTPALENIKKLNEESQILELTVNETRIRYDNLSKREKLLESKFRGEFIDLKQPMVEHLLRQYKKRPRLGQLTCTSITYLTEMGKCITNGEKSEILPKECLEYLKGMDSLDTMPSGLPTQIDTNHWNILCKLRRSKVEIEIRLKSCAVELAEAEQTFTSHQKIIQNSQNKIQQLRETIVDYKKQNIKIMRNMEIQLVLKMGQIETKLTGHVGDLDNAVLVPFDEVLLVNDAIVEAGRKKLNAMKRTMEFRRTIEWREWRHGCMRMTLEDMKEELKILQGVKVTKEIQKYLMRHRSMGEVDKDEEICEKSLTATKKRFSRILNDEKYQLFQIIKTVNLWQRKNDFLMDKMEKIKNENLNLSLLAKDETRIRYERFVRAKLKAIMKRNRLIKKIQNNYGELMSLQTQLELLRLKTYPTLRLKDTKRMKKII